MATAADAPQTKFPKLPKFPRRRQAGLALIGVGVVVAAVSGGMALFGGGGGTTSAKKPAATVNKYTYTTGVVDNWWNKALSASDRTTYCTAWKRDPTSTVATIQSGVNTNATAAAVFDPTAISAYFTSHCPK
ncbi:MAG TPA: hypothetical protein VHU88_03555 [Sporichthyaceae bacterium]|jgi:hypothetical protein|nr:hypothetical protein [Sporichthyaceae bacterium]